MLRQKIQQKGNREGSYKGRTVPWRRMFPRLGPLGPEIQQVSDQCRISNGTTRSNQRGKVWEKLGEESSGDFLVEKPRKRFLPIKLDGGR